MGQIGGGGSRQTTTSTESGQRGFDPLTNRWREQVFGAGEAAAGAVPNSVSGALDFLSGRSGGQQFMNPYQQQVIDQMNRQFQTGNELTLRGVNDAATRAGAFGGARHGIAAGTALAENARNRDAQMANLLYGGFQDATGRAQQAAALGMQAGSPDLWRLNILRQAGLGLPYGQTFSGTQGSSTSRVGGGFGIGFGGAGAPGVGW